jgi:hypothetical protein
MSKRKIEKQKRDSLLDAVRSLDVRIAELEPIASDLFRQFNSAQVIINRLRLERNQLHAQASSPYPLP